MKVSMHSYLPNAPINIRLNFNLEKLAKHETPLCGFAKVGLKGGENILECVNERETPSNCSKGKLRHALSTGLALKGVKIA